MMDRENMNEKPDVVEDETGYTCEKGDGVRSTPGKDLMAASAIGVISIFVMLLAARMPKPTGIYTHPGLLPFLTGLSLLAMAVGLAVRAIRMGGAKSPRATFSRSVRIYFSDIENHRTLLLIGLIVGYVVLIDLIPFELSLPTGFFVFQISSFELLSIVMLTLILKIFWRAALVRCLLISAGWIIALASAFRYAFYILMPGLT